MEKFKQTIGDKQYDSKTTKKWQVVLSISS